MTTYFISGHRDITADEFEIHYGVSIKTILSMRGKDPIDFVVGDCVGVDSMAQDYLKQHMDTSKGGKISVTVYHMFEKPRYNPHKFPVKGGYLNDYDRDSAMTINSDADILWVRVGKENSGTAQNLVRRDVAKCFKKLRKKDRKEILLSWGRMYGINLEAPF